MQPIQLSDRILLRLTGEDRRHFLQGIITNDVRKLSPAAPLYTALLNPQGKILYDFFLYEETEAILLDCASSKAEAILHTLKLYKLRSKVAIEPDPRGVFALLPVQKEAIPLESMADPRYAQMGYRLVAKKETPEKATEKSDSLTEYHHHRIMMAIPDSVDFIEDRAYVAEYGLTELNAVSFTKGCYVGQEVVARSRLRGNLRRILYQIKRDTTLSVAESWPAMGTPITLENGEEVGTLRSQSGEYGLAVLRYDLLQMQEGKVVNPLKVQTVELQAQIPVWFLPRFLESVDAANKTG